MLWLDAAKGIGIVAVVLGHALGGLIDAPGLAVPAAFRAIFLAIYIVHMPLFFFLAGLLVRQRIARSRRRFGIDLLRTIVWPYFLWSAVQYSVIFTAGSLVNSPVGQLWRALYRLPVSTISQFWFLYVLFFLHLAALIAVPRIGARGFLALALGGKIVAALLILPALSRLFLVHGGFYALGLWLGLDGLERFRTQTPGHRLWGMACAILAPVAVAIATISTIAGSNGTFRAQKSSDIAAWAWHLPNVPASLLGIAACIVLAMTLRGRIELALACLGRASMAIFVLHVLFVAGNRIVLARLFHVHEPAILLASGFIVGLSGPVLVYAATRRLGWTRMPGFGP